jgi:hypothetical protein
MKPVPSANLEAQLFGLSTLIQLGKRARHAATQKELAFIIVNETHSLVPYRQAALWQRGGGGGRVVALSGSATVERNTPFTSWLSRAFAALESAAKAPAPEAPPAAPAGPAARAVDATALPGALGAQWAEWLPPHGLFVPLVATPGVTQGALLLAREQPFTDGDRVLAQELADGYAHAWAAFRGRRRWSLARLGRARTLVKLAVVAALIGVMWVPVTLSALAPAEVVAFEPTIVRAPLEGVVDHFEVQPNDTVKEGQVLLELDRRAIENKLEVATKALAVAAAEYRQAAQQAVFDDKSRAQLAVLKGRMDQRRAEADYARSLLDRIRVTATRSGLALFDDPANWVGRPVSLGERLLEIADPQRAELEIWLPVADAITLQPGATVEFFLNVAPDAPRPARLRIASYDATMSPSGVLGYRLKAALADDKAPPRIGLRGTAKLYGERVTLFYYLMRRPLSAARQFLGL